MTCKELRHRLEDTLDAVAMVGVAAEHLAQCAECARFVDARRELDAGLHLLRDLVTHPSAALDATVLQSYRREIEAHRSVTMPIASRHRVLVICGGLAALLVAALFILEHQRRTDVLVSAPLPGQAYTSPVQSVTPTKSVSVDLHKAIRRTSARNHKRDRSPAWVTEAAPAVATGQSEFRSLMYCDELSCAGAMQLIRVKLLVSATPFVPNASSPNGVVYADVLVGPDGVARGIRIDE